MNAVSVYRRQDVMREICRRIGYQGRFVWLISTPEVQVLAYRNGGSSRLRFKCMDLIDYNFKKVILHNSKPTKLDSNTAIVALPTLRGRRRDLLAFLHPSQVNGHRWDTADRESKLSPEELAVLQKKSTFDLGTTTVAQAVCVYRGLVDSRGRLTERGAKLLELRKKSVS